MLPKYQMGYHLCKYSRHNIGMQKLIPSGDIHPKILYGSMKAAQVRRIQSVRGNQLTVRQMGMATQLMFTAIITLMKVAILLTYLRKLLRSFEDLAFLPYPRYIPISDEQVVLPCYALLHRHSQHRMLFCDPLSVRVRSPHLSVVRTLLTYRKVPRVPIGTSLSILARPSV